MDRRENVIRTVHFSGPEYVPVLFFNQDKEQSDIIVVDVVHHFTGPEENISEWGFTWNKLDGTMGQPDRELVTDPEDLSGLSVPDTAAAERFSSIVTEREKYGKDRYYLAGIALSGFTVMTFLYGFENTLETLYQNPDSLEKLADLVFQYEMDIISELPEYGFDGVAFYDDWGTQQSLMVSPDLWRSFFKHRYREQFDLAHKLGLDVYFHSCGYYYEIIPDLLEIGVDILNISQPNLYDIGSLGRVFAGDVCFLCPVSYQTTSISGTEEDIFRAVASMLSNLATPDGGFIGYVEEYSSIGMPPENYHACIRAFRELGADYRRLPESIR